jgi:hypothetical protein
LTISNIGGGGQICTCFLAQVALAINDMTVFKNIFLVVGDELFRVQR